MSQQTHAQIFTETPLLTKLGVSEYMKIYTINAPEDYILMLGDLPEGVEILSKTDRKVELVHIFVDSKDSLQELLDTAIMHIFSMGAIWVSWPRNTDKTDLSEQAIKLIAHGSKLRDEKFTIISDDYNGIMFRLLQK